MPRFKVWTSRCFEIVVEAENEAEALDKALAVPLPLWRVEHEDEHGVEPIEKEHTNGQ